MKQTLQEKERRKKHKGENWNEQKQQQTKQQKSTKRGQKPQVRRSVKIHESISAQKTEYNQLTQEDKRHLISILFWIQTNTFMFHSSTNKVLHFRLTLRKNKSKNSNTDPM